MTKEQREIIFSIIFALVFGGCLGSLIGYGLTHYSKNSYCVEEKP
jgi:hypothetical protein